MGPPDTLRSAGEPAFAALWQMHRRRMLDLAFRMLLDLGDAEDVVQEAFARLAYADIASLGDAEGWLVVVTSRLCLDRLRTRRRHPTDPMGSAAIPSTRTRSSHRVGSHWSTTSPWRCTPSSNA